MSAGRPHGVHVEPSRSPEEGWHCSHFYYTFDRAAIGASELAIHDLRAELTRALDAHRDGAPTQLQSFLVSGHKADFGVMVLDADPLKVDAVHQLLMQAGGGRGLHPTYSFVSMTELSEYVPTVEQYAERLVHEGIVKDSDMYHAKVNAYKAREPMMRQQRLTPDLPDWPASCFYPMNKKRKVGENWFAEPFSARQKMMAEHARSGIEFAGRVTQLITVSVGLDDWEWGVTLWAKNPQYLKDIVYRMRFDEASARYAEFGPFYVGYAASADEIMDHCLVAARTAIST